MYVWVNINLNTKPQIKHLHIYHLNTESILVVDLYYPRCSKEQCRCVIVTKF